MAELNGGFAGHLGKKGLDGSLQYGKERQNLWWLGLTSAEPAAARCALDGSPGYADSE